MTEEMRNNFLHHIALTKAGEATLYKGEIEIKDTKDFRIVVIRKIQEYLIQIALRPKTDRAKVSLRFGKIRLLKQYGWSNRQAALLVRLASRTKYGLENRVLIAMAQGDTNRLPAKRKELAEQILKDYNRKQLFRKDTK